MAVSACSGNTVDASGTGGTGGTTGATGGTTGATGGATGATGGTGTGGSSAGMGSGGTSASGGSSAMSSGGAGGMPATCSTMLKTGSADNYKFHSELSVDVTKVQPSAELHFDWSGVKKDLLGHDVDLTQIGMVAIGLWNLTLDQFEKKLNDDTLAQHDLAIIATIIPPTPGATTGSIYDLTQMGGEPYTKAQVDAYLDINTYPPENHLYTAMVANGDMYGKGTRMLTGFQLDAASTNTQVNITSDSTKLSLTADLHTLTPLTVPAGTPGITLDWTDLMTSAANLEIDPTQITKIRVGKYSISATDMEQQSNFLNLDALADTLYTATVNAGTSYDLSKTKDANMNAFPGIDDTHTWIVALNCGDCANPAPWYMTILKPCAK